MKVTEISDTDCVVHLISSTVRNFNPLAPPLVMASGVGRSGGLHQSQIIGDLYEHLLKKNSNGKGRHDEFEGHERMAMGFAWEHILSWAFRQVFPSDRILEHPGEFEKDGILMSPDGLDTEEWCGDEFKATWKSARKRPPEDYPTWMWQFQGYNLAMSDFFGMKINRTRLRVYHVNGSYHQGEGRCQDGPCIKTYMLEWSDREQQENWNFLLNHSRSKGFLQRVQPEVHKAS